LSRRSSANGAWWAAASAEGASKPAKAGGSGRGGAGRQGRHHARRGGRGRLLAGFAQALADGPDDEAAHQAGIAKAHFRLGRMDVDVKFTRRHAQEQHQQGMAAAGHDVAIGAADGAGGELVAHRPGVDEDMLQPGGRPRHGGQADEAGQPDALAPGLQGEAVVGEVAPHHLGDAAGRAVGAGAGGKIEEPALAGGERKGDFGMGHGQAAHDVAHLGGLGAFGTQELEAGGHGMEEIAHLHRGARGMGGGAHPALLASLDADLVGGLGAVGARGDPQARHRADGSQRLAAKPQGGDVHQIVVGELGGGMALDGQFQVVGRHAGAVVDHPDEVAPAAGKVDGDAPGTGIDGVFQQLLDDARGPLDDLAGGDAVDGVLAETAYVHFTPTWPPDSRGSAPWRLPRPAGRKDRCPSSAR
jgi:hypothetical protein